MERRYDFEAMVVVFKADLNAQVYAFQSNSLPRLHFLLANCTVVVKAPPLKLHTDEHPKKRKRDEDVQVIFLSPIVIR